MWRQSAAPAETATAESGHLLPSTTMTKSPHNGCNNNNKQICIAPQGSNFRGAGARQCVSKQRKKRKPGKNRNAFSLDLKNAKVTIEKGFW